ncbi:MAG: T9SS type A sorting domain-containing protein, partial [Bacteroidales bacterium]|nr:T9SS type A sorting domain-containing protein [Bacteroidales bacterium]
VINSIGQIVLETVLNSSQNKINVESLNKGIYIVEISNDEYILTKTLIIQ